MKNKTKLKGSCSSYTVMEVLKFLIPSLLGVMLFMMPIAYNGEITIPIAVLSNWLQGSLGHILPTIILILVMITAVGTIIGKLFTPKFIIKNKFLNNLFIVTPVWFVIRILAAVFIFMAHYEVGF